MKDASNSWVKFSLFHICCFLAGSVFFVLLFHTPLLVNAVLFYRGVLFLLVTGIIMGGAVVWLKHTGWGRAFLTYRDVILAVVLVVCLNLVFFTHVPVTADRSMSLFLLGYMNAHSSQVMSAHQFNQIFIDKYVLERGATQKRFGEQAATGTMKKVEGGYTITPFGKMLIRFFAFIADVFGINKKNLSM